MRDLRLWEICGNSGRAVMLSFASGAMLFWVAAVAVPIILHLLRRRRSRTLAWGAMRFLQVAVAKRAKRFQLWRFLLLLLRIAAIALLAVAVARPMLTPEATGFTEGSSVIPTLRVLVMDTSYSMRAASSGMSRMERARVAASEMVQQGRLGDGYALLVMGAEAKWVGNGVSYRKDEIAEQLSLIEAGEGRADVTRAIAAANEFVSSARIDGWTGWVEIIFFTDLQRDSWQVNTDSQSEIRYLAVDCSAPPEQNLVIEQLESAGEIRSGSEPVKIASHFRLTGTSGTNLKASDAIGQLLIDGRIEQSRKIFVESEEKTDNSTSRVLEWASRLSPGDHAIEVRAGLDDAIELDNIRHHVVTVGGVIDVAMFGPSKQDVRFLQLAATSGNSSNIPPRFSLQSYDEQDIITTELGIHDVWVLVNPESLTEADTRRIVQHLDQGGGVVWWLGDRWQPNIGFTTEADSEAETRTWRAGEIATAWGPGQQTLNGGLSTGNPVDPFEYRSPIISIFESYPGAGLLSLPVFRYWKLELGSEWKPVLGIDRSAGQVDPLIASLDPVGSGRQVIVTTPGGLPSEEETEVEPWNALIAWPAFLPLVQEIFQWAGSRPNRQRDFIVGDEILTISNADELGSRLMNQSGDVLDIRTVASDGANISWSAGPAIHSGIYRWIDGPKESSPVIAVNVDPREGDLSGRAVLSQAWVIRNYDEPLGNTIGSNESTTQSDIRSQVTETASRSGQVVDRVEIGWGSLILAILCVVAESALLRWMETKF